MKVDADQLIIRFCKVGSVWSLYIFILDAGSSVEHAQEE